jgi:hypothetical protein
MPQFRLTQKYAKDCRINTLLEPQPVVHPLDDWFIDVMRVHRKKIAMVTHAQSTFTLFIPYAEIGGLSLFQIVLVFYSKNFYTITIYPNGQSRLKYRFLNQPSSAKRLIEKF